jgi:hypothetical protein
MSPDAHVTRKTKVAEFGHALCAQQHVLRLQVPVNNQDNSLIINPKKSEMLMLEIKLQKHGLPAM